MSWAGAHRLGTVEAADWLTRLLPIFGALGVGSLLNTWLTGGSARRKLRADALKSLAVCERARWYPLEEGELHFVVAARDLEADAMIAGVPAEAVETYIVLGRAAAWLSAESMERDPDPEFGGGINSDYANVTRDAARLVRDAIRHPWRTRLGLRKRSRQLVDSALAVDKVHSEVQRSIRQGL